MQKIERNEAMPVLRANLRPALALCPLQIGVGLVVGVVLGSLAVLGSLPPSCDANGYLALLTARTYQCAAALGLMAAVCGMVREVRQARN